MTTLVAVKDGPDAYWIGSDTDTSDNHIAQYYGPKWLLAPNWALGVSGDLATLTILTAQPEWLSECSIPWHIRACIQERLVAANYETEKRNHGPPCYNQHFLLVGSPSIYLIGANLEILPIKDDYIAEGSGQAYAMGVFYALRGRAVSAENRARKALLAALAYDPHARGKPWLHKWAPEE